MKDILFLTSLVVLFLPPLISPFLIRHKNMAATIALAAFGYIIYAVFLDLLPEAYKHIGPMALITPCLGYGLTWLCEHHIEKNLKVFGQVATAFILFFFLVHSLIDGASLYVMGLDEHMVHHHKMALGYSVVLHRIVAIHIIWIALLQTAPRATLYVFLLTLGIGTILGFRYSGLVLTQFADGPFYIEAFVSGSLLHMNFGIIRKHRLRRA